MSIEDNNSFRSVKAILTTKIEVESKLNYLYLTLLENHESGGSLVRLDNAGHDDFTGILSASEALNDALRALAVKYIETGEFGE